MNSTAKHNPAKERIQPKFEDLEGKAAIVTGAFRGIGRQIALALADHGVQVTVASRKFKAVQQVADEVRARGGQAQAQQAHMGERKQVTALVRGAVEHWGRLDILVNVASIAGLRPGAGMGAYSISKAGVIMLTQVLARELGADNIQVNAIAPGVVKTKISRVLWQKPAREQSLAMETPLGRLGEPQDLIGALLLLASKASDWMTGAVIVVDGGLHLSGGLA
jgi:NAD(P)-dependent dehydrogenase (short-subunit alcohol dehydrogenase family)